MPTAKSLAVKDLSLDLRNFRTTPQKSETAAIRAMIAAKPDWFWGLADSLLSDGYHITENILVLKDGAGRMTVKEGNRRIAILKLCLGQIRRTGLPIPSDMEDRISSISAAWKTANQNVPCAVYDRVRNRVREF